MSKRRQFTPHSHEFFDLLRSLALPAGGYAVFGSGPLLVRGIIDTVGDLDVVCRGAAWRTAQRISGEARVEEGVAVVAFGPISFGTTWGFGAFDVDRLIEEAETIDGLPFVTLDHVITYKRHAQRPKDIAHLQLIDAWLGSGQ